MSSVICVTGNVNKKRKFKVEDDVGAVKPEPGSTLEGLLEVLFDKEQELKRLKVTLDKSDRENLDLWHELRREKAKNASLKVDKSGAVAFRDLSKDLLLILFMHADFVTQQRLARVCKRWVDVLSLPEIKETVFLDADSLLNDGRFVMELYQEEPYWRLTAPAVRQLTFNALRNPRRDFAEDSMRLVRKFARRCPKLTKLTIRGMQRFSYSADYYWDRGYHLTVMPFEAVFSTIRIPMQIDPTRTAKVYLGCVVPSLTMAPRQKMEQAFRDYMEGRRDEQIAWVVQCALRLTGDKLWLDWLAQFGMRYCSMAQIGELFGEGKAIGQKTSSELRDLIDVYKVNELAAYLLSREDVVLPRPAWKFPFENQEFYRQLVDVHVSQAPPAWTKPSTGKADVDSQLLAANKRRNEEAKSGDMDDLPDELPFDHPSNHMDFV